MEWGLQAQSFTVMGQMVGKSGRLSTLFRYSCGQLHLDACVAEAMSPSRMFICLPCCSGEPLTLHRHGRLHGSRVLPRAGVQGVGVAPKSVTARQLQLSSWAPCGDYRVDDRHHGKAPPSTPGPAVGGDPYEPASELKPVR